MKPEDLYDPKKMPEELHWLLTQHKLQPDDPIFLLLAWHWSVNLKAENTLQNVMLDLKTALDTRIRDAREAVAKVDELSGKLTQLHQALTPDPEAFARKVNNALAPAITAAKADIGTVQESAAKLLESAEAAHAVVQRREVLAALVAGVAFGVTVAVLFLAA
ncbi:MAG: hypothetical protein PHQ04_04095 [Opitutaceae bacterium]|nr:hypothetical protein [Opitutaceae bacterium]